MIQTRAEDSARESINDVSAPHAGKVADDLWRAVGAGSAQNAGDTRHVCWRINPAQRSLVRSIGLGKWGT